MAWVFELDVDVAAKRIARAFTPELEKFVTQHDEKQTAGSFEGQICELPKEYASIKRSRKEYRASMFFPELFVNADPSKVALTAVFL